MAFLFFSWKTKTQVIAFVAGFVMQDVAVTFWLFVAGVGLAAAVTVPPWPFLSSTPIDWREPRPEIKKKADEASSLGDSLKYAGIVVVAIVLAYVFPERANTILLNVQTLCARLLQAARS